eukprot:gene4524-7902_t
MKSFKKFNVQNLKLLKINQLHKIKQIQIGIRRNHKKIENENEKQIVLKKIENHEKPKSVEKESIGHKAVLASLKGNFFILTIKLFAYISSGSAAMLAETFHSLLDLVNQGLLFIGLRQASNSPDAKHQYGYGKASYFWTLVSAMGIFWIGCIGCTYNAIHQIFVDPSEPHFTWITGAVLFTSFVVDFSVFSSVIKGLIKEKPKDVTLWKYLLNIKDPMVLAVLLEDIAATLGVIIASVGIGLALFTGYNVFDGIASLIIGVLLGAVAWTLVMMNKRFLIGQSVDLHIQKGINQIITSRPSVEGIFSVQTQWYGPNQFLYKAEVDFNGIYLSLQLRNLGYEDLLLNQNKKNEIANILGIFSEDIMRVIEAEIQISRSWVY